MEKIIKSSEYLGILGGGQLGSFFTKAAQKMGYSVVVFDPDEKSPAGRISEKHICKPYSDLKALDELNARCLAITTEFENIPAETLQYLEKGNIVRPSSKAVSIAQNRIKEKYFLRDCGIPVGHYVVVENIESIKNINYQDKIFPGILKTAQFGYDGKGQIHVNNIAEVEDAFIIFENAPCILEQKLDLDLEFSIVLARSVSGEYLEYPLIENHHKNGILDFSLIPARVSSLLEEQATKLAMKIANELSYIGVMAVEFFISNNHLYVNEIAPRPHNSGHFSIDACVYNQFDQQVLAMIGNKPKNEVIKFPISLMLNLLGDLWFRNGKQIEPKFEMIAGPGISIHLYGKAEPRIGRKMGHITILGLENQTQEDVIQKTDTLRKILLEN
ncbi:MAG: 5-(carboxyamino)imidazole ribonucleotide synthase [Methylophilaceae bacterium]